MIRRRLADGEIRIPQDEHARQAGRLAARLFRYPGDAVVRAVSVHDAGWPHPSPHFLDAPPQFEAWRRSIAIARAFGPLEALLVSRHFSSFSRRFAAEQRPHEAIWRVGIAREEEEEGLAVLRLCDALSLAVLCEPGTRLSMPSPYSATSDGVVDPWPFRGGEFDDEVTADWVQSDQMSPKEIRVVKCRFRPK